MMWDVAAGVIIGGLVLAALNALWEWDGIGDEGDYERGKITLFVRALIALIGAGAGVWVIFFKAHW